MKAKTLRKKREQQLLAHLLKDLEGKFISLKIKTQQVGRHKNAAKILIESIKAAACGAGALVQIDNYVRRVGGFDFRFADSTLHDVLNDEVCAEHLANVRAEFSEQVLRGATVTVGNHNDRRLEIQFEHVDGTEFSGHFVVFKGISGLSRIHGMIRGFTDFEIVENKGKELDGADKIFERGSRGSGEGPPSIETLDGKFFCYDRLNKRKARQQDWFVRIRLNDGRGLEFVTFLEGLMHDEQDLEKLGVKKEEFVGFSGRHVTVYYSIHTDERFNVGGQKYPVLIGKVVEYLNNGTVDVEHSCYFITSALYLDGTGIYTAKRQHWEIETLFKILKCMFWSKNAYYESADKLKAVLNLILLSFLLTELVHEAIAAECDTPTQSRETTYKFAMNKLILIILNAETITD